MRAPENLSFRCTTKYCRLTEVAYKRLKLEPAGWVYPGR